MAQTKDKKKPLTKAAPAKDKKKHGAALSDDVGWATRLMKHLRIVTADR